MTLFSGLDAIFALCSTVQKALYSSCEIVFMLKECLKFCGKFPLFISMVLPVFTTFFSLSFMVYDSWMALDC